MSQVPESGHLGSSPQLTARLIHAAISFSVVMLVGVFLFLRSFTDPLEAGQSLQVLRWAGYAALILLFVVSRLLRARIRAPARGADLAQWWTQNLPQAITCWALLEALGLAAVVMGWLSGSLKLLMAGAVVSFILLFFYRPGALETPV